MAYLRTRGLGALPSQCEIPILNWFSWSGGRWCPSIAFDKSVNAAGNAVVYGNNYPTPPNPPHVPAVDAGTSRVPQPYANEEEYNAAIDRAIAEQRASSSGELLAFFGAVDSKNRERESDAFSIPWWMWALGGLGVFGLVAVGSGGPRRYGR